MQMHIKPQRGNMILCPTKPCTHTPTQVRYSDLVLKLCLLLKFNTNDFAHELKTKKVISIAITLFIVFHTCAIALHNRRSEFRLNWRKSFLVSWLDKLKLGECPKSALVQSFQKCCMRKLVFSTCSCFECLLYAS